MTTVKRQNPGADTTALEAEIDRQVYALYGLTPAEIKLIDESAQNR
jgi:adenine-specific DNA-methyltransferase